MTEEELQTKIEELTEAANGLTEPDKTFALGEVDQLKIKMEGMTLADLRQNLEQIQLPAIQEMNEYITAAKDTTRAYQQRVNALSSAIGLLRTGLRMLL